MQDPEVYLERLGTRLADPVHRDRDGVLAVSHRTRVNHETFFLASAETLEEFERRPLRYVGTVTDPVSGERFVPSASSPVFEYDGRRYFFADDLTLDSFREDPEAYRDPEREM